MQEEADKAAPVKLPRLEAVQRFSLSHLDYGMSRDDDGGWLPVGPALEAARLDAADLVAAAIARQQPAPPPVPAPPEVTTEHVDSLHTLSIPSGFVVYHETAKDAAKLDVMKALASQAEAHAARIDDYQRRLAAEGERIAYLEGEAEAHAREMREGREKWKDQNDAIGELVEDLTECGWTWGNAERTTDGARRVLREQRQQIADLSASLAQSVRARELDAGMGWAGIQHSRSELCRFLATECRWKKEGLETPEEAVIQYVREQSARLVQFEKGKAALEMEELRRLAAQAIVDKERATSERDESRERLGREKDAVEKWKAEYSALEQRAEANATELLAALKAIHAAHAKAKHGLPECMDLDWDEWSAKTCALIARIEGGR